MNETVQVFGRLLFRVRSRSRKSKRHLVDLEPTDYPSFNADGTKWTNIHFPYVCECEAFKYHGHRPCFHVLECIAYLALQNSSVMRAYIAADLDMDLLKQIELEYHDETHPTESQKHEDGRLPKRLYRLDPRNRPPRHPKLQ